MIGHLIALALAIFFCWTRFRIHELVHPAAFHAQDMVVVGSLVQLEHRMTALEVMASH